ncbi:MAG: hypothetical protein SFW35_14085 [Chitinophagales bacterium]|nr:hypothetical protein [Chitinophagales bacterium]
MFTIEEDSFGSFTQMELKNVLTGESVSIIHDFGTAINALTLQSNGRNYQLLRGAALSKEMVGQRWYKGVKLSPFPNRVRDGKYTFQGKEYQLPINEEARHNALHGFVYNKPFELIGHVEGHTEASVEFEYNYNGKVEGYPFPFRLSLTYILSEEGLECSTTVLNTGKEAMPIGDGWHPYFKTGTSVDKLHLLLPPGDLIEVDERLNPSGKKSPFSKFNQLTVIGDHQFDTGFALKIVDDIATTQLYDPQQNLTISLWQETGPSKYNFLQVYIPPDRQSIAIEPMTCSADAFNNGDGLIVLQPGEHFNAKYGVTLR